MKTYLVVVTFICCLLSFIGGRMSVKTLVSETKRDTVTVIQRDTVIRRMQIPKEVIIEKIIVDTLYSVDTIKTAVYLPVRKYVFSDSLYRAEITGYNVHLDKMEIYGRTTERLITSRTVTPRRKRFGIGISAGYGYCGGSFGPYVGVGVTYNIIMF